MAEKIYWTPEERGAVGVYVWTQLEPRLSNGEITLKQAMHGRTLLAVIEQAQQAVLTPDRRRPIKTVRGVDWLPGMIADQASKALRRRADERKAIQADIAPVQEVEEAPTNGQVTGPIIAEPVARSTPGQLLDSMLGLVSGGFGEVARSLAARIESLEASVLLLAETIGQVSSNKDAPGIGEIVKRIRNPKFVVVGLNKGQQCTEVRHRFDGEPVNLDFQGSDTNAIPGGERVFLMNKFISHKNVERLIAHVGKEKLVFVDGGVNDLCHAIRERLPKVSSLG